MRAMIRKSVAFLALAGALALFPAMGPDEAGPEPQIDDLAVSYDTTAGQFVLAWTGIPVGDSENYTAWQSPVQITEANVGLPPTEALPGTATSERGGGIYELRATGPFPTELRYFAVQFKNEGLEILSNNDTLQPEDGPPAAPSNLTVVSATSASVTLTWGPTLDNAVEIQILYAIGAGVTPDVAADPPWTPIGELARTIALPAPGTTYSLAARARNIAEIESAMSAPIIGETLPLSPPAPDEPSSGGASGGGGGCGGLAMATPGLALILLAILAATRR